MLLAALAATDAEYNAGEHEEEAEQERDDIAKAREKGRRCRRRQRRVDHSGSAPRQRLNDLPVRVDHGADPRWGRADDRNAFLRSAKLGLGEMLWRTPSAEPCIVGRIEDEVRTVVPVDDLARENHLV